MSNNKNEEKIVCEICHQPINGIAKGLLKDGIKIKCCAGCYKAETRKYNKPIKPKEESNSEIEGRYSILNGCIYKISSFGDNQTESFLCNFYFEFKKDAHLDDGITIVRRYEGIIHCNDKNFDFRTEASTFADDKSFEKFFTEKLGSDKRYDAFKVRDIRNAVINLMDINVERVRVRKVFGFDGDKYLTPSVIIDDKGIRPNIETPVDLSEVEGAKCLDLKIISDEDFRKCGEHIRDDFMSLHDPYYMRNLIGYGYISPVMSKVEDHSKIESFRYGGWAIARYSIGKSFAAKKMQNHFGNFKSNDILAFDSTPYVAGIRGYYFKDAFFLWDNFRKDLVKNPHVKTQYEGVIHNYADGNSRSRLNTKLEEQKSKWVRGMLFVTGEDIPQDKGGVVSRIHKIPVEPKTDRIKGKKCLDMQHLYPGFMAKYICWIIKTKPIDTIVEMLLGYTQEIIQGIENKPTADRIAKSHAVPLTGFHLFLEFMTYHGFMTEVQKEKEITEFKKQIMEMRDEALGNVKQASDTQIFIETIPQLLHSGRVVLGESPLNKPSIGFYKQFDGEEDDLVCIRPEISYTEIQKFLKEDDRSISVSLRTLYNLLFEEKDELGQKLLRITSIDSKSKKEISTCPVRHPITGDSERVLVFGKSVFGLAEKSKISQMDISRSLPNLIAGLKITKQPTKDQYESIIDQLRKDILPSIKKADMEEFKKAVEPIVAAYILGKGWLTPV